MRNGKTKSYIIGILAALFFEPFGLLYSTVTGGIIMIFVLTLGYITYYIIGESPYSYMFFWIQPPVNTVWSILAIKRHNKRIMKELEGE